MRQRVRVAAIVGGSVDEVRDAAARLPMPVESYVVETGAGVLVTLERRRRWLPSSRRRVIRGLQRDMAAIRNAVRDPADIGIGDGPSRNGDG